MKNNDKLTREQARQALTAAAAKDDSEAFAQAFDRMLEVIEDGIREDYTQQIDQVRRETDQQVLAARGVRQLTSQERDYYQRLAEAMRSDNPTQALTGLDLILPETVVNSVFDDLQTNHPLLSRIDFLPSAGAVKLIMSKDGYQAAAWGELCDEIVKELAAGFEVVDTTLKKLSAFLPVCKAMLELGPEWLDRYVREVLYEALANGLEAGILTGDGKDGPIGMSRKVGSDVSVVGGSYPEKEKTALTEITPATYGAIVATLAKSPEGKARQVRDLIMVVNPEDYYSKVMPATTIQAPDGTYRNDVLPYPTTIIQSAAVTTGTAILGDAKRYFAAAGTSKQGRIEYSDHAKFLEDKRVYLIKAYANGMPKDNTAFVLLDIGGLKEAVWRVKQVAAE